MEEEVSSNNYNINTTNDLIKDSLNKMDEQKPVVIKNWDSLIFSCLYCDQKFVKLKQLKSHQQFKHQLVVESDIDYQCSDCSKPLMSYSSFLNHVRTIHHESLKLCCDVCNGILPNYQQLSVHRENHMEFLDMTYPIVYHCTLCELVYPSEEQLKQHIQLVHLLENTSETKSLIEKQEHMSTPSPSKIVGKSKQRKNDNCKTQKIVECGNCAKSFNKEKKFMTHTKRCILHKCPDCEETFQNKRPLQAHMKLHRNKCHICSKIFPSKTRLKRHMNVHTNERSHKCEICHKDFKYLQDLTVHVQTHSEDRPFECEICKKRFKLKRLRKRHMSLHSEEKLFKCHVCKKRFNKEQTMQNHIKDHSGMRMEVFSLKAKTAKMDKFKCEICGKGFTNKRSKDSHVRRHKGERPFKCKICPISFTAQSSFYVHMLRHKKVKPLQCKFCEETCKNNLEYRIHLRIHYNELQYACEICSKRFYRPANLKYHLKKHKTEDENIKQQSKNEKENDEQNVCAFTKNIECPLEDEK